MTIRRRSYIDLAGEAAALATQAQSTGHDSVALAAAILASQYLALAQIWEKPADAVTDRSLRPNPVGG